MKYLFCCTQCCTFVSRCTQLKTQYLQYFQPLLCCIFRPRITGPWQGAVTEPRQRCRAVRRVPPTPVFPHSRADGVSGQPPALGLPDVSEMYLKISAVNLAAPEKMRYIIPGHPASGTYHIASNISAYT